MNAGVEVYLKNGVMTFSSSERLEMIKILEAILENCNNKDNERFKEVNSVRRDVINLK